MKVRYQFLMLFLGMFLVSSGNAASGKIRTIHELPEYSASILVAYTGTISVPYFQTTSTSGSLDMFVTESTPVENLSTLSGEKHFQKPVSSTYIGTYTGVVPYSLISLPGNHSLFLLSGSLGQTFVFDGKRASWFDEVSSMNPSESGDVTFFVRQGDIRTVYRNTTPYLTLPTIHIDTSR